MEHTPGPWTWYHQSLLLSSEGHGDVLRIESDWDGVDTIECNEADRALIAAAPDLLAACKAALNAFQWNDHMDWNALRRAIDKAEGK